MNMRKVAIIGDGMVGSSIAFSLLLDSSVNEISIIDINKDKAEGDALDMKDGLSFLSTHKKVTADGYEGVKDAHVVVITAGAAQKEGETRLDLLGRNRRIYDGIIEGIRPYLGDETIVLVVSNPVDVLSHYVYSKLGIPENRVIGSGTVLDTSRLRTLISLDTGVDPKNVHTYVLGEHGDTEVAIFSATSIGGVPFLEHCEKCGKCGERNEERLDALESRVKNAAYEIIKKKGSTHYAVALAVRKIVEAILNDEKSVLSVSTYLKEGFEGEVKDVYMSLPSIVGSKGVEKVFALNYRKKERDGLVKSAKALREKIEEMEG